MKSLRLKIHINKPPEHVFAFTLDPKNTPKWIDFIAEEKAKELPVKLGTIYQNREAGGEWRQLKITAFEANKTFTLTSPEGYNVSYKFTPTDSGCELEYFEWMEKGNLDEPFELKYLEKLKSVMEA